MKRASSLSLAKAGVAEALPKHVPVVLFLGGPFAADGKAWKSQMADTFKRLEALEGEKISLKNLFGPFGKIGFDPLKPSQVGLTAAPGLAFFYAERAVGFAAEVRSPKKWQEAIKKASLRPLRKLKVKDAVEAGLAVLDDDWEIAYARRPPWLYTLAGFSNAKEATALLADLVAVSSPTSLAAYRPFRKAIGSECLGNGATLWLSADFWSRFLSPSDSPRAPKESWSDDETAFRGIIGSIVRLQGLALGLSVDDERLHVEGLVCAEGSLFDALDSVVGRSSQCVVGPRALSTRCPVWAISVMDWSLLVRSFPAVGKVLDRVTGQFGDLLPFLNSGERGQGVAAIGISGLRPFPTDHKSLAHSSMFSFIDAFLVVEMLGQAFPAKLAGRVMDTMGGFMRGGLKRFIDTDIEELSSATIFGHKFFAAFRGGAMILATSRDAMKEAQYLLGSRSTETLPLGFILSAQSEPHRFSRQVNKDEEPISEEIFAGEFWGEIKKLGRTQVEVQRVPAGLRLVIRQIGST